MTAAMARILGLMCAALLFAGVTAREASACEGAQQRSGAPAPQKTDKDKNDKGTNPPPSRREGPKKWWIDAELRRELGITDQQ